MVVKGGHHPEQLGVANGGAWTRLHIAGERGRTCPEALGQHVVPAAGRDVIDKEHVDLESLSSKDTHCLFGIAVRDVTPPVEIYARWWGATPHEQATGIHRPFTATAAVFAPINGIGANQVLVALDHCSFQNFEDERALRAAIRERAGVEDANLLFNLSHSHAAANTNSLLSEKPGGDVVPGYLARLAADIGDAVAEAQRTLAPAWITHGVGRCNMAANRDYWDAAGGHFVCGYNPGAPADDTVMVGRVTGEDGAIRGILFNYACHPTTLAWDNRLLSPDFVGAARAILEEAFSAPALFLQGASGDLGPREGFVGESDIADRNGRQLGYAAASAVEALPPPATTFVYRGAVRSGTAIGTWAYQPAGDESRRTAERLGSAMLGVELEPKAFASREELEAQINRTTDFVEEERLRRKLMIRKALGDGATHTMPLWVWRLGAAVLVAVPEEPYAVMQQSLRQRFPDTPVWVLGVTNGGLGYLPPRETYGTGRYQEVQSPYRPGCLEDTIDAAKRGIASMLES